MATDWCIYVIDLDPKVWHERAKMRNANRDYDPDTGRGCLYVGITSTTPQQRLAQNRAGGRAARPVVRDFGRYLRPRLYQRYPRMTQAKAEKLEPELAQSLRERGYAVWPIKPGGAFTMDSDR